MDGAHALRSPFISAKSTRKTEMALIGKLGIIHLLAALLLGGCGNSTQKEEKPKDFTWSVQDTTATLLLPGGTEIPFVWCPPATFTMGDDQHATRTILPHHPAHKVTLTRGFWISRQPVTQQQHLALYGKKKAAGASSAPQTAATWFDARDWVELLNTKNEKMRFRLPTEAEWERACRTGREKADLFEWTHDFAAPYTPAHATDPRGPESGSRKVLRGEADCVARYRFEPGLTWSRIGFCVVAEVAAPAQTQ